MQEKLNKIYSLYESGKYNDAFKLNNEVLKSDPNNIYAKRYDSLLSSKISTKIKSKIPKVKGKQLRCPHCLSKISFSALTETQQNRLKDWKYNNLEIKCPYCHTKFVLQKKSSKSILWLKIWEVIKYKNKSYRITWYVEYLWKWIEWKESWVTSYFEWLLLWKNNEYLYFSEWYFIDDWEKKYEFEFSEKFIPQNEIDKNTYKEKNNLTVKSIYWENSKSYKVWEKVEILDFWDFVLEKEWSWSQLESWFYKTYKVNRFNAMKIFNKFYSDKNKKIKYMWYSEWTFIWRFFSIIFLLVFLWSWWEDWSPWDFFPFSVVLIGIAICFIIYFILFILPRLFKSGIWLSILPKRILIIFIIGPIFTLISMWFFSLFESKSVIEITNITDWKKYEIRYNVSAEKNIKTKRYDYGWIRTYYEQKVWLKFSVKWDKDKEIIEKIISEWKTQWWEIEKLLKWKAYIIN